MLYTFVILLQFREVYRKFRQRVLCYAEPRRVKNQSPVSADLELPLRTEYQQTLRRCITIGGIGLHTGDYAYIRIRPTPPGEGRYFVIVAKGLISESPNLISERQKLQDGIGLRYPEEYVKDWEINARDRHVEAFLAYNVAKSKGYDGSVDEFEEDFLQEENHDILKDLEKEITADVSIGDFEVISRTPNDIVIPATVEFARSETHYTTVEKNAFAVNAIEHLLAALEACGVDNCRIEVEGGREIPIIDGTAQGWTTLIIRAGVVPCEGNIKKKTLTVHNPLIVLGENGSFISLSPSKTTLITAGWDAVSRGAPSLGRAWYTWDVDNDFHFHYSVAPAKTFYHSEYELDTLYDAGLVQAGPSFCSIVAMGESFLDPTEVTFPDDEAARHKVIDLTGDLALLSTRGQAGLPIGHVVAWNADHALQLKFCVLLWNEIVKSKKIVVSHKLPKKRSNFIPTYNYKLSAKSHEEMSHYASYKTDINEEKILQKVQVAMENDTLNGHVGNTQ